MKEAPNTIKYGRIFRLKLKNDIRTRYLTITNYRIGLKALEHGWLDSIQLNSVIRLLKIFFEKNVKIKLNCSLFIPVTKKPLEMRMGSGKAERKFWKCPVTKGMIILELDNLSNDQAEFVLSVMQHRFPFKTSLVRVVY